MIRKNDSINTKTNILNDVINDSNSKTKIIHKELEKKDKIFKQGNLLTFFKKDIVLTDNKLNSTNNPCKINTNLPEFPKDKPVTIYSWNVAGLRAILKREYFTEFIKKENPDILCLNETKIDDDLIYNSNTLFNKSKKSLSNKEEYNFLKLLGKEYQAFYNCCKVKKGYSGVAIFTKYKPLSVKYGIGIEEHDQEGRVITMEFEDLYVVATYIPNAGEGLKRLAYRVNKWDVKFQSYLINLRDGNNTDVKNNKAENIELNKENTKINNDNNKKIKKHVIWIGDINVCPQEIDIHNPIKNENCSGFTIEERNSFAYFLKEGFIDTFRQRNPDVIKYSFWNYKFNNRALNKGWRLDNIVVNKEAYEYIINSEILNEYMGSDHCPIKATWFKI